MNSKNCVFTQIKLNVIIVTAKRDSSIKMNWKDINAVIRETKLWFVTTRIAIKKLASGS